VGNKFVLVIGDQSIYLKPGSVRLISPKRRMFLYKDSTGRYQYVVAGDEVYNNILKMIY